MGWVGSHRQWVFQGDNVYQHSCDRRGKNHLFYNQASLSYYIFLCFGLLYKFRKPIPFHSTLGWIINYCTRGYHSFGYISQRYEKSQWLELLPRPKESVTLLALEIPSSWKNVNVQIENPLQLSYSQRGSTTRIDLLEIHTSLSVRKRFNNLAKHCQKVAAGIFRDWRTFLKIKFYPHMLSSPISVIKHQVLLPSLPEL